MKNNKKEIKNAIALSYDQDNDQAPKLVAKGKGDVAKNIINLAKDNDVTIMEDPSLIELLGNLDINETIPEELYQVVAEIFAFVYQMDQKLKTK